MRFNFVSKFKHQEFILATNSLPIMAQFGGIVEDFWVAQNQVVIDLAKAMGQPTEVYKSQIRAAILPTFDWSKWRAGKIPPTAMFITHAIEDSTGEYHGVILRCRTRLELLCDPGGQEYSVVAQTPLGYMLPEAAMQAMADVHKMLPVLIVTGGVKYYEYWGWDKGKQSRLDVINQAQDTRSAKAKRRQEQYDKQQRRSE